VLFDVYLGTCNVTFARAGAVRTGQVRRDAAIVSTTADGSISITRSTSSERKAASARCRAANCEAAW
jgi:hypothetical protein